MSRKGMNCKVKGPKINWDRVMELSEIYADAAIKINASVTEMNLAHGQAIIRATISWQQKGKP